MILARDLEITVIHETEAESTVTHVIAIEEVGITATLAREDEI